MTNKTAPKRKMITLDTLMEPPTPVLKDEEGVVERSHPKTPSYRQGKRAFTAWAREDAYRQLKKMAAEKDTTVQALLEEGMDAVFERHGYDQIARKAKG